MNKREEVALRKAKFQQMLDELIAEAQERDPSEIWENSPFHLKEPVTKEQFTSEFMLDTIIQEQEFSDTHKVNRGKT